MWNFSGHAGNNAADFAPNAAVLPQRLTNAAFLLTSGAMPWPNDVRRVARAPRYTAMLADSTSAGFQSIVTKPGVCSTRRSQARIAGKIDRSYSQRSATWV